VRSCGGYLGSLWKRELRQCSIKISWLGLAWLRGLVFMVLKLVKINHVGFFS
jgi:hypothetical protein